MFRILRVSPEVWICMLLLFPHAPWPFFNLNNLGDWTNEISAGKFQIRPMNTICRIFRRVARLSTWWLKITQWNKNIISDRSSPQGLGWKWKYNKKPLHSYWDDHLTTSEVNANIEPWWITSKFCMYTFVTQLHTCYICRFCDPTPLLRTQRKNQPHVGTSHVSLFHDLLPGAVATTIKADQSWHGKHPRHRLL